MPIQVYTRFFKRHLKRLLSLGRKSSSQTTQSKSKPPKCQPEDREADFNKVPCPGVSSFSVLGISRPVPGPGIGSPCLPSQDYLWLKGGVAIFYGGMSVVCVCTSVHKCTHSGVRTQKSEENIRYRPLSLSISFLWDNASHWTWNLPVFQLSSFTAILLCPPSQLPQH